MPQICKSNWAWPHPKGGLDELHDAEEGGQEVPLERLPDSDALHVHRLEALRLVGAPDRVEALQRQHIHLRQVSALSAH